MNCMRVSAQALKVAALLFFTAYQVIGADKAPKGDLKQLFFEERKIEGKIRRPQLVLIKAEQRPEFEPMVIQSLGRSADIVSSVENNILEQSPYDNAFQFREKRISNYKP